MTTTTQKTQSGAAGNASGRSSVSSTVRSAEAAMRGGKAPSAFRTISEVADDLRVPQHVLRFWETKFTQVKPLKRGGGRRYYRPEDVALLKKIHHLLYTEGYTIKGVQKLLKSPGVRSEAAEAVVSAPPASVAKPAAETPVAAAPVSSSPAAGPAVLSSRQKAILESMLGDLKELRTMIRGDRAE